MIECKYCSNEGYSNGLCEECFENCDHEWDLDEGGMCLNCGRDDYYNFIGE